MSRTRKTTKSSQPLVTSRTEWTPALIERMYKECEEIALGEMELDVYANQIEIISAEQMLDAYASIGMPVNYSHWSFGKEFLKNQKAYERGRMGLAYEIVINSDPCISYLMEENSMLMQTMVIAHAAFGHNTVFKNNETFKQWTNAGSMIDYMIFARDYIRRCENRYGPAEVELVLDAAHAVAAHSVDKYKRKHRPRLSEEARLKKLIEEDDRRQREKDIILEKTTIVQPTAVHEEDDSFEEEENLLYFIMKKSPNLEPWKREICRIVWKINQYFYPQGQTQTLNEGMASFTHHYIMTRLEEKGLISPDAYMAFLDFHAGVIYQPEYNKRWYSGFNPYALGFNILRDVKRICDGGSFVDKKEGRIWVPTTKEDEEWFPHMLGTRWQDTIKSLVFEHRDDSFIAQGLSPKVIRDMHLFSINMQSSGDNVKAVVTEIHDDLGYRNLRTALARSKERINMVPQIAVVGADLQGDRALKLKYTPYKGRKLDLQDAEEVVDYIDHLWGYAIELDA